MLQKPTFRMIDNYIYLYHTDTFVVLPTYPDSISDTMSTTFSSENPIARSAPIYAFSNAGPRSLNISLPLHRNMMSQINYGVSNLNIDIGDDYVDTIIKNLQSISVPRYVAASKMVNPPMIAVRFGNDIFIKGIVNGSLTCTYSGPILSGGRYAQVEVSFTVTEIDPYSAETIAQQGSFRGFSTTLERNLYKV